MAILVLSAGRDAVLLKSRNDVLASIGCSVTPALSSADLVNQFFDGDHDLLVLCHSVPLEERRRVLRMVKTYRPSLRTLLVSNFADDLDRDDVPIFLKVTRVAPEPDALIKAINSTFPRQSDSA